MAVTIAKWETALFDFSLADHMPAVFGRSHRVARVVLTAGFLVAGCSVSGAPVMPGAGINAPRSEPPLVSDAEKFVSFTLMLDDSFELFPDGGCAGLGENTGIRDGASVQLRGITEGGSAKSTASVRLETHKGPSIVPWDDGLYCVTRATFTPSIPDADGYLYKFEGGDWTGGILANRGPYGASNSVVMACGSSIGAPAGPCPEGSP